MKYLITAIAVLAGLCLLATGGIYYYLFKAGDRTPLQTLVPADALVYADVKSIRELALEIASSDQADAYAELAKIGAAAITVSGRDLLASADSPGQQLAAGLSKLDGVSLLEAAAHLNRQVAFFILESDSATLPFHAYAIAHFQGDPERFRQAINKLLHSAHQAFPSPDSPSQPLAITTKKISGTSIHVIPLSPAAPSAPSQPDLQPCWTIVEQRLIAGLNPSSLAHYLTRLTELGDSQASLATQDGFALAEQRQGAMDGQVYLNMEALVDVFARSANDAYGETLLQMGVSLEGAIEGLGLRELRSAFYVFDYDSNESLLTSGATFRKRKGVLDLYASSGGLSNPRLIPDSSYASNCMALDIGEAVIKIKDATLQAAPMLALMYPAFKQQIDQRFGQDIETFALSTFTAEIHAFNELILDENPKGSELAISQSQNFIIGLENPAAFKALLSDTLSPLETQEGVIRKIESVADYEFVSLQTANSKRAASTIGYAIAQDKLFIGVAPNASGLQAIKDSLALFASGNPGAYQSPRVSEILAEYSSNRIFASLLDFEPLIHALDSKARQMKKEAQGSGDSSMLNLLEQVDWDTLKKIDHKALTVAQEEEGLILARTKVFRE